MCVNAVRIFSHVQTVVSAVFFFACNGKVLNSIVVLGLQQYECESVIVTGVIDSSGIRCWVARVRPQRGPTAMTDSMKKT